MAEHDRESNVSTSEGEMSPQRRLIISNWLEDVSSPPGENPNAREAMQGWLDGVSGTLGDDEARNGDRQDAQIQHQTQDRDSDTATICNPNPDPSRSYSHQISPSDLRAMLKMPPGVSAEAIAEGNPKLSPIEKVHLHDNAIDDEIEENRDLIISDFMQHLVRFALANNLHPNGVVIETRDRLRGWYLQDRVAVLTCMLGKMVREMTDSDREIVRAQTRRQRWRSFIL